MVVKQIAESADPNQDDENTTVTDFVKCIADNLGIITENIDGLIYYDSCASGNFNTAPETFLYNVKKTLSTLK